MLKLEAIQGDIIKASAQVVVVNLFEGITKPTGAAGTLDKALGGLITDELKHGKVFSGKLGETLTLNTHGKLSARYVVVVGLGKPENIGPFELRRAAASAVRACQKLKVDSAATILHGGGVGDYHVGEAARLLAEGSLLGAYQFVMRKSKSKQADAEASALKKLTIFEQDKDKLSEIKKHLKLGQTIARNVLLVRDWVNDSPNNVTPTFLKDQAEAIEGLECDVLDFKAIKKHKMGLFELVTKGSDEPPFLIHLTYKPTKKAKKKITLVGKGLTFDSGGLSLKPAKSMELMKMDMGGAAVVIAVMKAIAELTTAGFSLDVQVDGYVGTCENMPSGGSSKPGDIVVSMNGKTVEVNNTDAEGRLVLADVLTYAQQKTNPDEIIDLATLTGACIVALGSVAAGVMGTDDDLIDHLIDAGAHAGEKLWQLPLYEEYRKALDSEVADLINANAQGEAGSQNGGMFLKEFIDEGRTWAHIDIAGPTMISRDYPETPKGATGFGVRTLLYYLYHLT